MFKVYLLAITVSALVCIILLLASMLGADIARGATFPVHCYHVRHVGCVWHIRLHR